MKPGHLWLLLPLAAWAGYKTAPPKGAEVAITKEAPVVAAAAGLDPALGSFSSQLEKASVADLEKQFLELLANPDSPDGSDRMNLLCARWAELDPAGALAFFKANKDPGTARQRLLTEWALLDSEAAWAAIPPGHESDYDREAVTRMLLNEDRGIFMQWLRKNPAVIPDDDLAWTLLAESHGKELEQIAKTLLEKAAAGDDLSYGVGKFFALLAKAKAARDPAAACQWAAGLDPRVSDGALHAAFQQWSESDPQEVWKRLNSDDPLLGSYKKTGAHGDSLGGQILQRIVREDPALALQMIRDSGDAASDRHGAIQTIRLAFPRLLTSGKLSAIEAYRLIDSAKAQHSVLGLNTLPQIWSGLSADGLAEAARSLATEPPGDQLGRALGGVANAWMKADPAAAAAFIAQIQDRELRAAAYAGCFASGSGGEVGPRAQAEILAGIPADDRAEVFASYLARYGDPKPGERNWSGVKIDPELLGPVFKDLPPSPSLNRSVTITTREWGQENPAAALAWADSLADGGTRQAAYAGTFEGWAFQDPHAAAGWLADKADGPERDAATLPLVRNLLKSDAGAAWEWSDSIGDPALRLDARVSTLQAWSKRDPEAAQAAYHQIASTLPAAEAAKLSTCLTGS